MLEVGFEPTPPKRIELKSTALDPSAIPAQIQFVFLYLAMTCNYACLAQMVERMTLNHVVVGSIPTVGVINIYFLCIYVFYT